MNDHSPKSVWLYRLKALLLAFAILGVLTAVPFLMDLLTNRNQKTDPWYTRLLFASMKGMTFGYFFFIGSSIGSFINVVAYRMPLGKSVITTPSACPRCRKKIKGQDNLPVFGWLLLGGKCRNCALPISKRYPLVEFWFGTMASILFLFEAILGASNLPGRERPFRIGIIEMIWGLNKEVLVIYGYHFLLLVAIATLALFKLDRNRIPILAGVFFLLALAIPPYFQNFLHPVMGFPFTAISPTTVGLSLLLGGGAGIGIGFTIEQLVGFAGFNGRGSKGFWLAGCLVGLALGWQAALSTAVIFSFLFFFSRFLTGTFFLASGPTLGIFNLAVIIQICLWKSLTTVPFWPGDSIELGPILAGMIGFSGVLLGSRYLIPNSDSVDDYTPEGYGEEVPEFIKQEHSQVPPSVGTYDLPLETTAETTDHDSQNELTQNELAIGNDANSEDVAFRSDSETLPSNIESTDAETSESPTVEPKNTAQQPEPNDEQ